MTDQIMAEIIVSPSGRARSIYGEVFDFGCLGAVQIHRASFPEPDGAGRWWADLSPVDGPKMGPFNKRSAALEAELTWLRFHLPLLSNQQQLENPT